MKSILRNGSDGDCRSNGSGTGEIANDNTLQPHPSLCHLPSDELLARFGRLVQTERKITHMVLEYIAEIDSRRLFLDKAYPSLFEFMVHEFGYSSSAAIRRIESARLLREIPELGKKIESGALNLSQLSQVQQAIRTVQKTEDRKLEPGEKSEILNRIEHTTQRQTEVILSQTLSIPALVEHKQKIHGDESVTLTVTFSKDQFSTLSTVQGLIAHAEPEKVWANTFMYLAQRELQRRTNKKSVKNSVSATPISNSISSFEMDGKSALPLPPPQDNFTFATSTPVAGAAARKPLSSAPKKMLIREQGHCQFKDPASGKVCGSRRLLQIDHIQPVWAGGTNDIQNLQVLCAQHNRHKYRIENSVRITKPE
ncbi:HNH endonuclease [Bdellovibrio sp. GT3]|uniref:HNH endonuclease n=1 Tax=Bdellovibrio sp. GT3 TaxID=3136282 RepID=UPI0030EFCFC9